ncbi:MAG TPA: MFS transporter [Chloroflexota bacterium]|nr:MFS transporter [Chloroflexota bacterium]
MLAVLALAWLTAFSSRSNTISVGSVLPLIQRDLGLSYAQAGLLFGIPVLMMGLFSIPSGLIMARVGVKPVLLISLSLLALGGGLRAVASNGTALFVFTAILGAGIGLVQPALPRLIKDRFTHNTGLMTGIYSNGFSVGATVAAALAVPVLVPFSGGLSWRGPFIVWAAVVALTLVAWLFVPGGKAGGGESLAPFARIFRNRVCWIASGIFLTQSMLFYILNSWLTSYYQSLGFSLATAASTVALLSAASIVFGFAGPAISDRAGRRPPFVLAGGVTVLGVLGLMLLPTQAYWFWPLLIGSSTSVLFTTGFVIPVDVARSDEVGAFTGLMLTVGFGGVMIGPPLVGFLRDITGSNLYGLLFMLAIAVGQLWLTLVMPETRRR